MTPSLNPGESPTANQGHVVAVRGSVVEVLGPRDTVARAWRLERSLTLPLFTTEQLTGREGALYMIGAISEVKSKGKGAGDVP